MSERVTQSNGDEDLVTELARVVLLEAAPEELVLFDETAQEYFLDPEGTLEAGSREEAVGFGLELALITPAVLAIVTPVVKFLVSIVSDATKEEVGPVVKQWVRALFRTRDGTETAPAAPQALTLEQAQQVRRIAHDRALQLGISEKKALLLADAVVGGVMVAG